jgi:hypothetical protein
LAAAENRRRNESRGRFCDPHGVNENRQVVIEGVAGRQGVIVRKAGNYRLSAPKQFAMQLTSA